MILRLATRADVPAIRAIYAHYVEHTTFTFETEVLTEDAFWQRILQYSEAGPWLIAEIDGAIAGYAYASMHRSRPAYGWTREMSVYVSQQFQRKGIAHALYAAIVSILRLQGIQNVLAGIVQPNPASEAFHSQFGFKPVGVYHRIGFKLGAFQDVGWWELFIGDVDKAPEPVRSLNEIVGTEAFEKALGRVNG